MNAINYSGLSFLRHVALPFFGNKITKKQRYVKVDNHKIIGIAQIFCFCYNLIS